MDDKGREVLVHGGWSELNNIKSVSRIVKLNQMIIPDTHTKKDSKRRSFSSGIDVTLAEMCFLYKYAS